MAAFSRMQGVGIKEVSGSVFHPDSHVYRSAKGLCCGGEGLLAGLRTFFMGKNGNARLHSLLSRVYKKSLHRCSGPLWLEKPHSPGLGSVTATAFPVFCRAGTWGGCLLAQQRCGFSLRLSPCSRRPGPCAPPDVCPQ